MKKKKRITKHENVQFSFAFPKNLARSLFLLNCKVNDFIRKKIWMSKRSEQNFPASFPFWLRVVSNEQNSFSLFLEEGKFGNGKTGSELNISSKSKFVLLRKFEKLLKDDGVEVLLFKPFYHFRVPNPNSRVPDGFSNRARSYNIRFTLKTRLNDKRIGIVDLKIKEFRWQMTKRFDKRC